MNRPEAIREWVKEEIETLGKIKPQATERIVAAIISKVDQPANKVALQFRKEGHQLEADEKKCLGLTAKSFLSREALDDLTEEGLQTPLQSHELTILRYACIWSRGKHNR